MVPCAAYLAPGASGTKKNLMLAQFSFRVHICSGVPCASTEPSLQQNAPPSGAERATPLFVLQYSHLNENLIVSFTIGRCGLRLLGALSSCLSRTVGLLGCLLGWLLLLLLLGLRILGLTTCRSPFCGRLFSGLLLDGGLVGRLFLSCRFFSSLFLGSCCVSSCLFSILPISGSLGLCSLGLCSVSLCLCLGISFCFLGGFFLGPRLSLSLGLVLSLFPCSSLCSCLCSCLFFGRRFGLSLLLHRCLLFLWRTQGGADGIHGHLPNLVLIRQDHPLSVLSNSQAVGCNELGGISCQSSDATVLHRDFSDHLVLHICDHQEFSIWCESDCFRDEKLCVRSIAVFMPLLPASTHERFY
mmetsp:Transcript_35519/g.55466  ORF Transcript_35519/g.55466 Transcript_35519/m.55466 type:complete len:356 (-) Transcript_35519:81-1148(-)